MHDYSDEYEKKRFKADELEKNMKQTMADVERRKKEYHQKIVAIDQEIKRLKREERKQEAMMAVASESSMEKVDRLRDFGKFFSEENDLKYKKRELEKEASKYEFDMDFKIKETEKEIRTLRESAKH